MPSIEQHSANLRSDSRGQSALILVADQNIATQAQDESQDVTTTDNYTILTITCVKNQNWSAQVTNIQDCDPQHHLSTLLRYLQQKIYI